MSDEDLFAEEMAGVTPLGRDARVRLVKERLSQDQREGRRRAAEGEEAIVNPLADEGIAPLDAWYILEFKRPGIQNGVYRKLRLGHYQLDARLDLHRFADQAGERGGIFVRPRGKPSRFENPADRAWKRPLKGQWRQNGGAEGLREPMVARTRGRSGFSLRAAATWWHGCCLRIAS